MAIYTVYLGTFGGCDETEECSVENVEVECGEHNAPLRRRDVSDGKQTSKVPIKVKFAVKVPLPSNTSQTDLNQTTQQLSSDILAVLNKTDLNLNISGIVLEYDTSKPPVFRFVGLVCDRGQVLRGTKCGKILGYNVPLYRREKLGQSHLAVACGIVSWDNRFQVFCFVSSNGPLSKSIGIYYNVLPLGYF